MDLKEMVWEGLEWIHPTQEGDYQQAVINTVINIWFHEMCGI